MLGNPQPERPLGDNRFGLKLADQRASDSSIPVLRQNQKIRKTNFASALNDDYPTDRRLIQKNEPIIQSRRHHRVVTLKASVYQRDQLVALRVIQICVLEAFPTGPDRTDETGTGRRQLEPGAVSGSDSKAAPCFSAANLK